MSLDRACLTSIPLCCFPTLFLCPVKIPSSVWAYGLCNWANRGWTTHLRWQSCSVGLLRLQQAHRKCDLSSQEPHELNQAAGMTGSRASSSSFLPQPVINLSMPSQHILERGDGAPTVCAIKQKCSPSSEEGDSGAWHPHLQRVLLLEIFSLGNELCAFWTIIMQLWAAVFWSWVEALCAQGALRKCLPVAPTPPPQMANTHPPTPLPWSCFWMIFLKSFALLRGSQWRQGSNAALLSAGAPRDKSPNPWQAPGAAWTQSHDGETSPGCDNPCPSPSPHTQHWLPRPHRQK